MEGDVIELKRNLSEHELSVLDSELAKYKKSTALAYVLWFFLGGLGIHKFYIGKTEMGIFYLLLVGGIIVGAITGMSKEIGPAMVIAGSCGLVLGILLLVDLFTIPRQIRRTYVKAERQIVGKIKSTPKDSISLTSDSSARTDIGALSAEDKARIEEAKLIADDVIVQCLHDAAKDGNITAMIFWLKNRRPVEWRDKHDLEHTGDVTYRIKYAEGKDDPLVS